MSIKNPQTTPMFKCLAIPIAVNVQQAQHLSTVSALLLSALTETCVEGGWMAGKVAIGFIMFF